MDDCEFLAFFGCNLIPAATFTNARFTTILATHDNVLAICASTGDTSAAAALYASFLQPNIKSAVLLPHKKVTPQQLSQPLGSGAAVFEIPGVFDDCMKIVEHLSETYNVALLNSKNAWRILGQESFAYEVSQAFEYDMDNKVVVIPVGNAGNITAIMNGFIKFFETGTVMWDATSALIKQFQATNLSFDFQSYINSTVYCHCNNGDIFHSQSSMLQWHSRY